MDDYPESVKEWNVPDGADTRLDNPKYIYFGRNGIYSMNISYALTLIPSANVLVKASICAPDIPGF